MKITKVRAVHPHSPQAPPDWRSQLGQIAVAVDTDAGLTGYGVGGGGAAAVHVVRTIFRDMLLGHEPEPVEGHWDRLYRATLPYGRKGLAIMALSGVDLALWDLRGKTNRMPMHELLGGARHRRIPVYASLGTDPAEAVAAGYTAVKLHLPPIQQPLTPDPSPQRGEGSARDSILGFVAHAREVIGPNVRLMVDAFMGWDVESSLALASAFRDLNVEWLEEPLPPDDYAGYAALAEHSPIPIAGGEHEYTAAGFQELAERRLHAVLQPDVTWCGGMTELVKIYRIAAAHNLRVCPHRGAEPWALHAIAALEPHDPLAEAGRPWLTWVHGQPQTEAGSVEVPDRPGFGIALKAS